MEYAWVGVVVCMALAVLAYRLARGQRTYQWYAGCMAGTAIMFIATATGSNIPLYVGGGLMGVCVLMLISEEVRRPVEARR